jgi:hypothetical protein
MTGSRTNQLVARQFVNTHFWSLYRKAYFYAASNIRINSVSSKEITFFICNRITQKNCLFYKNEVHHNPRPVWLHCPTTIWHFISFFWVCLKLEIIAVFSWHKMQLA